MKPPEEIDEPATVDRALARFLERSPCPFVDRARVFSCAPWSDATVSAARLDGLARELQTFLKHTDHDLAVLKVEGRGAIESPARAASFIHALLAGLRERDGACGAALCAGIEDPEWDFEFVEQACFVSLFAQFYPDRHPRWSGAPDLTFVLLQPERGFRRFGVSAHRPNRRTLSTRVQERFTRQGRPYDAEANRATPKALRYVKPIDPADPPIAWWKFRYEPVGTEPVGSAEPL